MAAHVVKTDAYKLETFKSPNSGPIGYVDEKHVYYHSVPIRHAPFNIQEIGARVDLIKTVAGMDGGFITAAIARGADGIVIEGFGRGHVPPPMVPAIRDAIDAGITVVVTSRCATGIVRDVYDFEGGMHDLLAQGAVAGTGLPGTKARIKLVVVLSQTRSAEKIRSHFSVAL
jgi:L-asparaginase